MIFGIFFDFEQDNVIISFFSYSISFLSVLEILYLESLTIIGQK